MTEKAGPDRVNVIHYATVITLLEKENKLREIKTRISKKEKQGWQIRMENRIVALRWKISYVIVLMECYKNQKYTRHQRDIKMQNREAIWRDYQIKIGIYQYPTEARIESKES